MTAADGKKKWTVGKIMLVTGIVLGGTCGTCAICATGSVVGAAKKVQEKQVIKAAADDKAAMAPENVEISALLRAYKDNEIRADAQYKDHWVAVAGKVGDVKKGMMDSMYITVGTGAMFEIPQVQCYLKPSEAAAAMELSKGRPVMIRGRVDGLMMNVQIKDCDIMTKEKADAIDNAAKAAATAQTK